MSAAGTAPAADQCRAAALGIAPTAASLRLNDEGHMHTRSGGDDVGPVSLSWPKTEDVAFLLRVWGHEQTPFTIRTNRFFLTGVADAAAEHLQTQRQHAVRVRTGAPGA
jgi:hypothetical protein